MEKIYNLGAWPGKCVCLNFFSYFSTVAYAVGSFEHPKHMFKSMCKKIITILHSKFWLS